MDPWFQGWHGWWPGGAASGGGARSGMESGRNKAAGSRGRHRGKSRPPRPLRQDIPSILTIHVGLSDDFARPMFVPEDN